MYSREVIVPLQIKVNSGLLINLDITIFVMKNDLKYSILIFSVMLEVNL